MTYLDEAVNQAANQYYRLVIVAGLPGTGKTAMTQAFACAYGYSPGWLLLARWHMEERTADGYKHAKEELRRFLESGPPPSEAAEAWHLLGVACDMTNDALGEIHALIERAQYSESSFYYLSNTANKLNLFLRDHGLEIDREQKRELANRIFTVLNQRRVEANADDLSRMAWLAIHSGQEELAREFVREGLELESENYHLSKLAQRLGIVFNQ